MPLVSGSHSAFQTWPKQSQLLISAMPAKKRAASPHPDERPAKMQNTKGSSPTRRVESATLPLTAKLRVKRLNELAQLPTRGSLLAAGYDLYRYIILC